VPTIQLATVGDCQVSGGCDLRPLIDLLPKLLTCHHYHRKHYHYYHDVMCVCVCVCVCVMASRACNRNVKYKILFICQFYNRVHSQRQMGVTSVAPRRQARSQKLFTPTAPALYKYPSLYVSVYLCVCVCVCVCVCSAHIEANA